MNSTGINSRAKKKIFGADLETRADCRCQKSIVHVKGSSGSKNVPHSGQRSFVKLASKYSQLRHLISGFKAVPSLRRRIIPLPLPTLRRTSALLDILIKCLLASQNMMIMLRETMGFVANLL